MDTLLFSLLGYNTGRVSILLVVRLPQLLISNFVAPLHLTHTRSTLWWPHNSDLVKFWD